MKAFLFIFSNLIFLQILYTSELVLVTDDWPPYYGRGLKNEGFSLVIAREAYKYSGIDLKIEYFPWNRVIIKGIEGEYVGVFGAYYNAERAIYFFYSDPIINSKTYLIGLEKVDINPLSNDDLVGLRIGVTKGYFYSEEFSNYQGIRFVTSYSVLEGLEKLIEGRIDLLTADHRVADFYLKQLNADKKLHHIEPPIAQEPIYIIINKKVKNAKYYITTFNEGLQKLKESGRYNEIIEEGY